MKSGDEKDVHQDIGSGRKGQEEKRCPGVSQSREDSSCYIIKEQKRKSKDIDVQVQPGIAKNG